MRADERTHFPMPLINEDKRNSFEELKKSSMSLELNDTSSSLPQGYITAIGGNIFYRSGGYI
jgi:hypothetical protein